MSSSLTARIASRGLARHRSLRPRQHVLHVCLRDRRTTLAQRPTVRFRHVALDQGHLVDTVVSVEIRVLDRHHRLAQRLRHLREGDEDPVDARVQLRDLVAVGDRGAPSFPRAAGSRKRCRRVKARRAPPWWRPAGRGRSRGSRSRATTAPPAHQEGRQGRGPRVTAGARSDGCEARWCALHSWGAHGTTQMTWAANRWVARRPSRRTRDQRKEADVPGMQCALYRRRSSWPHRQ